MDTFKVFMSYSWSSPEHEDWVISLAQRLVNNGVDVSIDKWDLKEGQDKYSFMESMIKSEEINKVLIILDEKYTLKANERDGGVGTETQIISPNIYKNVSQEKFIPIVSELDEDGKPFIPIYLEGRIYIDLSLSEHYEANYEKLLRNILNRPSLVKPKIGKVPSYLLEETPMNFKTTSLVRGFDSQMDRYPNRISSISRDFFDEFYNNLKNFKMENVSRNYIEAGKQIFENLTQYTPLRNDYIEFISKLSKSNLDFDVDILIGLFEKLPLLLYPEAGIGSWMTIQFDNFRFIINELFIYTITIFLKNQNYPLLEGILYTKYFINDLNKTKNGESEFTVFNYHIESIDHYYTQLNGGKVNCQADFMIVRIPENFDKSSFVHGDLLCYYIALFQGNRWFPKTYLYKNQYDMSYPFFNRLISKRHFDKIKGLLNVDSIEDLKTKLTKLQDNEINNYGYPNSYYHVPQISELIDVNKIAVSN